MWENSININEIKEVRGKTLAYLGVGAINKVQDIASELKSKGINSVIVVTGKSAYKLTGAWDYVSKALNDNGIKYEVYDKVMPNPTIQQVDEATELGKKINAQAVIGIGGGSPIDAAKSVAILLEYTDKNAQELYEHQFVAEKAAPIIAINLTHGTGTEVDRFAVVSILEKDYKPAIAYDCIYPLYAIDDPALTVKLPKIQTLYVSIDALNHAIEACTTKATTPYSILLAKEAVRLVAKYLPQALKDSEDLTARYFLMYASLIAGTAFDNALLHFTHALEHPLSAIKPELAHGLGLSMLLPAVIKHIYPKTSEVLADVLSPIISDLSANPADAEKAAKGVEKWLFNLGVTQKLEDEGFKESDIEKLVQLSLETPALGLLLSVAPIEADKATIASIYRESLQAYNKAIKA